MLERQSDLAMWLKVFGGVFLAYLLILLLLFLFQRALIFPAPQQTVPLPEGFEQAIVETEDGLEIKLAYRLGQGDLPTIVFFHGNGDSWSGASEATRVVAEAGYGVLLPEYRGYAGNPGSPSETGLYADGRASLDFLESQQIARSDIVLIGNSIGSGVAVQMASEADPSALILISPFTSVPDVASQAFPWAPARWLVRDQFDNAAKLPDIDAPILILHGTVDSVIPFAYGERLARLNDNTTFLEFEGAGHELAYLDDAGAAQRDWLTEQLRRELALAE